MLAYKIAYYSHEKLRAALFGVTKSYQSLIDRRAAREAKKQFPKRKINYDPAAPWNLRNKYSEIYNREYEKVKPRFDEVSERLSQELAAWKNTLDNFADQVVPQAAETEIEVFRINSGAYWSQGFGATEYARDEAERVLNKFLATGVPTRLEEKNIQQIAGCDHREFFIYSFVEDWMAHAIKKKTENLVDTVRDMWKRGINPRVVYPFLPYDFEQKHNIK